MLECVVHAVTSSAAAISPMATIADHRARTLRHEEDIREEKVYATAVWRRDGANGVPLGMPKDAEQVGGEGLRGSQAGCENGRSLVTYVLLPTLPKRPIRHSSIHLHLVVRNLHRHGQQEVHGLDLVRDEDAGDGAVVGVFVEEGFALDGVEDAEGKVGLGVEEEGGFVGAVAGAEEDRVVVDVADGLLGLGLDEVAAG